MRGLSGSSDRPPATADVVVIGGGHNGLTAAAYLARAGRQVVVLEAQDHVGGAAVSARVFPGVDVRLSRYSYLVSLLPQQIRDDLALPVRLIRRRYSSYTPDPQDPSRGLLVDAADPAATSEAMALLTGLADEHDGWTRLYARIAAMAERLWPTMLEPLRSREQMRELSADPSLFDALTTRPLLDLLAGFLRDDRTRGIAATDGLIGTFADLEHDLAANVCFLYHVIGGGTGDWDVPEGGMGVVTDALAHAATRYGATLLTDAPVTSLRDEAGEWVVSTTGGDYRATHVVAGCAPATLGQLLGDDVDPAVPQGSQLKVNMVLRRLPRLLDQRVTPEQAFAGTFHIHENASQLQAAYRAAAAGHLPDPMPCEVYCHTLTDPSILAADLAMAGVHTMTVFALHVPAALFCADHDAMRERALHACLRSIDSVLAEPIEPLLMRDRDGQPCIEARTPLDLQDDARLPGGNIFHRPLQWPWAERAEDVGTWGVHTAYPRLWLGGAGARRGGGVSGIAGYLAARAVLEA